MEILNIAENKNFKKLDDRTYLIVNTGRIVHIDNFDDDMILHHYGKIEVFEPGLLCVDKKRNSVTVFFLTNDGKKLFEAKATEMEEMENRIYDMHAYGCSSGVLVTYWFYDQTHFYEYYTYNGAKIMSNDFDKIKEKVDKFEQGLPVYKNSSKDDSLQL